MRPCASNSGATMLSTQYSRPSLARLQISPRHARPLPMVPQKSAQNAASWWPELMMLCGAPISSSRV